MSKQLKFDERRKAVVQLSAWFTMTEENLKAFGDCAHEHRYSNAREHQAHLGMLQMNVHRAMHSEGMTDESGLCACLTFTEITSTATHAEILLFSDMTDMGGFRADYCHMKDLLHRVADENGFKYSSLWNFVAPEYRKDTEFMELLNA